MDRFIKGMELGERFYNECVKQIIDTHYPGLKYSVGLIGAGSEIIGFDTSLSRDHNWGPRLMFFLAPEDDATLSSKISQTLSENLPYEFYGYSTNYGMDGNTRFLQRVTSDQVNHMIEFYTIEEYFHMYLGINPYDFISTLDWLTFEEHKLLSIASGKVFFDGLGQLRAICDQFSYYPHDLWLLQMASQWRRISQEEAFLGRCGDVGDELGSQIIASRLVRDLMRLCFLMEKQYAPYNKWFGSAFSKLNCSDVLYPLFVKVLQSKGWKERELCLSKAYQYIANKHNDMRITEPLETAVSNYYDRPYLVIHAGRFADAIWNTIQDEKIKNLSPLIGSVNQFVDSTDVLDYTEACRRLQFVYENRVEQKPD